MKLGISLVLIWVLLCAAGVSFGAIVNVPADQPTIQAGIDAALTGDTVLVADGHYYERINFLGKAITVASGWLIDGDTAHIGNTIIDGDTTVLGVTDTASTVRFENGEGRNSVLSGFTLQNGYGTDYYSHRSGGAVLSFGASPSITNCRMMQNTGGDLLAFGGGQPLVFQCTLLGGVISENWLGGPTVDSCWIGAVVGSRYGSFKVSRSHIKSVIADSYEAFIAGGEAVLLPLDSTRSSSTRMRARAADSDPSVSESTVEHDAVVYSFCILRLSDCEIGGNAGSADDAFLIADRCTLGLSECGFNGYDSLRNCVVKGRLGLPPGTDAVLQNTTVSGGALMGDSRLTADSSIIVSTAGSAVTIFTEARIWAHCSNFWSPDTSWLAGTPTLLDTANIFSADPQFCDTANGNYGIRSTSPCAPANNSCGALIGAMPVSCVPGIIQAPTRFPTIQAAIDASYDGDTVLIDDGVYYERISFKGKKITVASRYILDGDTNHIANTIIDGDTTVLGVSDTGSVVRCVSGEDTTSILAGVTVRNGLGTLIGGERQGGGVYATRSVKIGHCRITKNRSQGVVVVEPNGPLDLVIRDSQIEQNLGTGVEAWSGTLDHCWVRLNDTDGIRMTGGIGYLHSCVVSGNGRFGIWGPVMDFYLANCTVEHNDSSGIMIQGREVADCIIRANGGDGISGTDMSIWGGEISDNAGCGIRSGGMCTVSQVLISQNQGGGVQAFGRMEIELTKILRNFGHSGSGIAMPAGVLFLTRSLITDNTADSGGALSIGAGVEFSTNCSAIIENVGGSSVSCSSGLPPAVDIRCTDIFGNEGGDWVGCIADQATQNNNFSADPLFCDSSFATLAVHASSPCLAANSPCSQTVGNVTLGSCQGLQITNVDVPPNMQHVIVSNPVIYWSYTDDMARPQTQFEIAVGFDTNWTYAECWNPSPVTTSDTFVTYGGSPLIHGTTYYFRLRLHNGAFWSSWYNGSFHTNGVPSTPIFVGPLLPNPVTNTPTLVVQSSVDPEGDSLYCQFAIYSDSMLTQLVMMSDWVPEQPYPDTTTWTVTPPLEENRWYYWHARAFDGFQQSAWNNMAAFIVNSGNEPPSAPVLLSPPDSAGLPVFTRRPTLYWSPSTDPDPIDWVRYRVQVSLNESFTPATQFDSLWINTMLMPDSLPYATHLWWRVWAVDHNGAETLCPSVRDFWIWVPGDIDHSHSCDIGDLSALVDFLFFGAEINPRLVGDINNSCSIDISDLSYMIDYLFFSGPPPREGC